MRPSALLGSSEVAFSSLGPLRLKANSFEKLVNAPTHKDGNCLDQAFVRDVQKVNKYSIQVEGKYYSDHKALSLIIER